MVVPLPHGPRRRRAASDAPSSSSSSPRSSRGGSAERERDPSESADPPRPISGPETEVTGVIETTTTTTTVPTTTSSVLPSAPLSEFCAVPYGVVIVGDPMGRETEVGEVWNPSGAASYATRPLPHLPGGSRVHPTAAWEDPGVSSQYQRSERNSPPPVSLGGHWPIFLAFATIIQIAIFVISLMDNGGFESLRVNPTLGPSASTLNRFGAKNTTLILEKDEWWRFGCPLLLHAGVFHIVPNVAFQVWAGFSMERSYGWYRVGLVYLVSGVGGNLASAIFLPQFLTVGASSALFGLVGILLGDLVMNWSDHENPGRTLVLYLFTLLLNLAVGLLPFVDNFNHLGGLLVGLGLSLSVLPITTNGGRFRHYHCCLMSMGLVFVFCYFLGLLTVFYERTDAHEWCSFCSHISCVDFGNDWCEHQ